MRDLHVTNLQSLRAHSVLSRHLLLFAALTALLFTQTYGQTPFAPPSPCSSTQRFDISSLSCIDCGTNRFADLSGRFCVCSPGEKKTVSSTSVHVFTCAACASSVASRDSSACMVCDGTTGATLNANASDCACPAPSATFGGYRIEESDALGVLYSGGKRCVACPSNGRVFPSVNAYRCQLCPHPNQTMDSFGACTCIAPYTAAGASCILSSEATAIGPASAAAVVSYSLKASDDGSAYSLSLNSATLLNLYWLAAAGCQFYQDEPSCEALGNTCVLQKYSSDAAACRLFNTIAASRTLGVRGFTGWQSGMPFLKYNDDTVRSSAYLQSQYSLSSQPFSAARLVVSNLKFVLAKYQFNGTFIGFEDLSGQLQLCGGSNASVSRFLRFGSTFENSCKFSLPQILSWPDTVFYDLYILDTNSFLFPVPVEVVNYKGPVSGGSTQLFGRFFIYDNIAAKTSSSGQPAVITYAKSIKLSVSLQSGSSSTIYPPVLTIEYADREVSSFASNKDANTQSRVSFSAEYTRDLSGFWLAAVVLLAMSVVIIVILWFGKIYRFQKLNMVEQIDLLWLARAGVFALAVLSEVFYWLIFILTAYCWLFFKGQSTAYFLLPERSSSAVSTLSTFVALCFFAKLIDVLHKVWNQIHSDIYFVDWEKPRGYLPKIIHKDDMAQVQDTALPVSVWRKLFITNRWNELQTVRAVSSEVTLFGLLFFLRGIGLEYLETSQPAATDLSSDSAPIHPILRYCVTTFFWIGIAGAQLVFRRFVYNRYVEDKAAQFVDLLSFTNISCFIFDGKYHCYYLHGKSVHTHADASLEELTAQIASEQKSLTRSRGLIDGQDTFEVFVSRLFRARYDKVYRTQLARELRRAAGERRRAQEPRAGMLAQDSAALTRTAGDGDYTQGSGANTAEMGNLLSGDKMLLANAQLNEFLIAFIEKNDPQYPWEEGAQSFCERRFDLPPYLEKDSPVSMFYPDTSNKFTQSVLMGIEYDLLLLFSLLYACLDLLFSNTFVSILVTYVAERALRGFRFHWGKINVSRKTLVNERFLI